VLNDSEAITATTTEVNKSRLAQENMRVLASRRAERTKTCAKPRRVETPAATASATARAASAGVDESFARTITHADIARVPRNPQIFAWRAAWRSIRRVRDHSERIACRATAHSS